MTTSSPRLATPKAGLRAHIEHKQHVTQEAVQAMNSAADPAEVDSLSSDPTELRRDIEEVRGELANTVDALAAKADVKRQMQEFKVQATDKAQAMRAQAMAKAPQLTKTAQQKAQQAQLVIQDKSGAAAGAALAALVLLALRRRRRRRDKDQKAQQARGRSRTIRARRGTRVLAVLGSLHRCRRREENS
jgi:MYXO-CTERM domain-containing protein